MVRNKVRELEGSIYTFKPGIYELSLSEETLSSGEGVEILDGYGHYRDDKLSISKQSSVWVPHGSTLVFDGDTVEKVPFKIIVTPLSGTDKTRFRVDITGARPDKRVQIVLATPAVITPVLGERFGNGHVDIQGLLITAGVENVPVRDIQYLHHRERRIEVCGVEKSWWLDRKTPAVVVSLTYPETPVPKPPEVPMPEGIEIMPPIPTPQGVKPPVLPLPSVPPAITPPFPFPIPVISPAEEKPLVTPAKVCVSIHYLRCKIPPLNLLPPIPYILSPLQPLPGFEVI